MALFSKAPGFSLLPAQGLSLLFSSWLKMAATSHGRSMKTEAISDITKLMEGRALTLSVMR